MSGWYFINPRYPFTYSEPPESITLERTNHSASVRYVPERGECHVECFDDGVDEALDGSVIYLGARWFLSCDHEVEGRERPNYCPICGRMVVSE
jgi:rubrerythrin